MFGAWGNATVNKNVVQLRALDWDFEGPYRKYPLVIVYHPSNTKDGNKWVNIGFMGWLGDFLVSMVFQLLIGRLFPKRRNFSISLL